MTHKKNKILIIGNEEPQFTMTMLKLFKILLRFYH